VTEERADVVTPAWPWLALGASVLLIVLLGVRVLPEGVVGDGHLLHLALAVALSTAGLTRLVQDLYQSWSEARALGVIGTGPGALRVLCPHRSPNSVRLVAGDSLGQASLDETRQMAERLHAAGHRAQATPMRHGAGFLVLERDGAVPPSFPLTPRSARALILSVLDQVVALGHVSSRPLGDLRPGSVLVKPDGSALLLDLAPPFGSAPGPRSAPEVRSGLAPTAQDDVYVLAAFLCEALSGEPAPEDGQLPPKADWSSGLEDLVRRCLSPRPSRPRDLEELRELLVTTPFTPGLLSELVSRFRARTREGEDLDRLRDQLDLRARIAGRGDVVVYARGAGILDWSFLQEGGFTPDAGMNGAGLVLGGGAQVAVRDGEARTEWSGADLPRLVAEGIQIVLPDGARLELGEARVVGTLPVGDQEGVLRRVVQASLVGRAGHLASLRAAPQVALRHLADQSLRELSGSQALPADIAQRLDQELARRLLGRSLGLGPEDRDWLLAYLPEGDPGRTWLGRAPTLGPPETCKRARIAAWRDLAVGQSVLARQAMDLVTRFAEPPSDASIVRTCVLTPLGWAAAPGLITGSSTLLSCYNPARSGDTGRGFGCVSGATDREALEEAAGRVDVALRGALGGRGGGALLDLEGHASAHQVEVPLFVAVGLVRRYGFPLPADVAACGRLGTNGIEGIEESVVGVVDGALRSGIRLLLVPASQLEEARFARNHLGAEPGDMEIEALPETEGLLAVLEAVMSRLREAYPQATQLTEDWARRVLDTAHQAVLAQAPAEALVSLRGLEELSRGCPDASVAQRNLRALCLAHLGRGHKLLQDLSQAHAWYERADEEVRRLQREGLLDWRGAELLYDLPNLQAASLLLALAFDEAARRLEDNLEAKRACPYTTRHSLAKSSGTLGLVHMEWGICLGPGPDRERHFQTARAALSQAMEGISPVERGRELTYQAWLETYAGDQALASDLAERARREVLAGTGEEHSAEAAYSEHAKVLIALHTGHYAKAAELACLACASPRDIPLHVLARLRRLWGTALLEAGDLEGATRALEESLETLDSIGFHTDRLMARVQSLAELARARARGGALSAARDEIAKAREVLEACRAAFLDLLSAFSSHYLAELDALLQRAADSEAEDACELLREVCQRIPY
jgi:hypothetical protein